MDGEAAVRSSDGTDPGPPEGLLARALGTDSSPDPKARTLSIPDFCFQAARLPELDRHGSVDAVQLASTAQGQHKKRWHQ